MAPQVLGIGLPWNAKAVPEEMKGPLRERLENMDATMNASQYDWNMLYITPDDSFDIIINKLHEKKWDVVMIGGGIRTVVPLTAYFERIVNAIHKELPSAKMAFNANPESTEEAVTRALAL